MTQDVMQAWHQWPNMCTYNNIINRIHNKLWDGNIFVWNRCKDRYMVFIMGVLSCHLLYNLMKRMKSFISFSFIKFCFSLELHHDYQLQFRQKIYLYICISVHYILPMYSVDHTQYAVEYAFPDIIFHMILGIHSVDQSFMFEDEYLNTPQPWNLIHGWKYESAVQPSNPWYPLFPSPWVLTTWRSGECCLRIGSYFIVAF